MSYATFFAALFLSFAVTIPGVAAASEALAGEFGAVAAVPLTDEELAAERGGLQLPTGLEVGFGASVRTYIDGALVLETQLVWTDQGAMQTQSLPSAAAQAGGGGIALQDGAAVLPGLLVPGDGGSTAVLHDLSSGRLANIVVNTANNRDIRQEMRVDLAIPELSQFQQAAIQDRANLRMLDAANVALRDAALR